MDIQVNTRSLEDATQEIEVVGEMDVHTAPQVKSVINELLERGHYQLRVHLGGVATLDSSGLGVLIWTLKRVRDHQGRLVLVTSPQVHKIFALTGLEKVFEIQPVS